MGAQSSAAICRYRGGPISPECLFGILCSDLIHHYVSDDAHYTMVIIIDGTNISRGVKATSEALCTALIELLGKIFQKVRLTLFLHSWHLQYSIVNWSGGGPIDICARNVTG
jgi:hypothetical protein